MPRYIVKLTDENVDYYMEWSTIVDAPITFGMSLEEFKEYYQEEYGRRGMEDEFENRMKRVEKKGTSSIIDSSVEAVISCNLAGDEGECLTRQEIIQKYCIEKRG